MARKPQPQLEWRFLDEEGLNNTASHLFTVRLWWVEAGAGQYTVRIQAKHVLSGEMHYFQTWAELVAFLQTKISNPQAGTAANPDLP